MSERRHNDPTLEQTERGHVVLRIPGDETHRMHLHLGGAATGGARALKKSRACLPAIRRIQVSIVGWAEQKGVPVIESRSRDRATPEVMKLVLSSSDGLEVAL